jgi:hypothetical protein
VFGACRKPGKQGHRILVLHAGAEAADMQYFEKPIMQTMTAKNVASGLFTAPCACHVLLLDGYPCCVACSCSEMPDDNSQYTIIQVYNQSSWSSNASVCPENLPCQTG